MLNRDGRREQHLRAGNRLKRAHSYVVVTFDGKSMPVFSFDVGKCKDEHDIRHVIMQEIAAGVQTMCKQGEQAMKKATLENENSEKVQAVKDARSEELASFSESEGVHGGENAGVPTGCDGGVDLENSDGLQETGIEPQKPEAADEVPAA